MNRFKHDPKTQSAEHTRQATTDLIFTYICDYIDRHDYPPSIRDIAQGCQVGKTTVHYTLNKLEAWGWLEREPHAARSLRIVRERKPSQN